MFTKATTVRFGASASLPMESSTPPAARTVPSRCGRTAKARLDSGDAGLNLRLEYFEDGARSFRVVLGIILHKCCKVCPGSNPAIKQDSHHKIEYHFLTVLFFGSISH